MNAILNLAGIVAPAALVALAAGGVSSVQCGDRCGESGVAAAGVQAVALGSPQESRMRTHIKVVQQDDSGTYELVIENGEPRAKVNGKDVPADRIIKQDDGVWVIQDEHGEQVAKFHVGSPPQAPRALDYLSLLEDHSESPVNPNRSDLPWRLSPQSQGPNFLTPPGVTIEQPRTMLGVVMGPAPDQGDGAGGVLLDRIVEGLPADRAGLKSGDVIIGIEGADEATPEKLRALLREKAPGDELQVRVLRDGEEKDFTIKLDAFDGDKLVQAQPALPLPPEVGAGAFANSFAGLSREAREEMHKALQALTEAEQLASGDARRAQERAREAIEQFVGALERLEAEGLSTSDAMRGDLGRWFSQFKDDQMVWGDQPGMVFTLPRNAPPGNRPGSPQRDAQQNPSAGGNTETSDERIRKTEQLEARLNAMSARLERIEKLLEKLTADGAPAGTQPDASDRDDPGN